MKIELKFENLGQNDWCLVLIYPDYELGNAAYFSLGEFQTTLVLSENMLSVYVTIKDKEPIVVEQELNSVQRKLIEDGVVKYLTTGYHYNSQLFYHPDLPINLRLPHK